MRGRDLAGRVLQKVRIGSLQHPGRASAKARSMIAQAFAASAGFDADQLHSLVAE